MKKSVTLMILHCSTAVFTQRPQSSGFQRELNGVHISNTNVNLCRLCSSWRPCTSLLTLRSSVFLLSSRSFSWSLEVTGILSVIRVNCSSVDSNLSVTGVTSSVLHIHRHTETFKASADRQRVCAINKTRMKNISREFPLISKHMHKRTAEYFWTPTCVECTYRESNRSYYAHPHTHTFTVTLCTQETQSDTHTELHVSCIHSPSQSKALFTIRCVSILIASGKNVGDDPRKMLICTELQGEKYLLRLIRQTSFVSISSAARSCLKGVPDKEAVEI